MRLKTKLVVAATSVTFAIVIVLSALFVWDLLRQRIEQTGRGNDLMAREVLTMAREAVATGLVAHPPADGSGAAFEAAVAESLRSYPALNDLMEALVRYSPEVQDVSVTDARGWTLVSTDPQMWNQRAATRESFREIQRVGPLSEMGEVFGQVRVLDVSVPLARNGAAFLVVHLGVRSSFLRESYYPWLKRAMTLVLVSGLISMVAAGVLASLALRPIEEISQRLEGLTAGLGEVTGRPPDRGLAGAEARETDAVVRVTRTIDRLGLQMRTAEAGYVDLQTNLNQMLDRLRDGVVLFTAERRAVMVSDAVAHFVNRDGKGLVGQGLTSIFAEESALGQAVLAAFELEGSAPAKAVRLEDGREVEIRWTGLTMGADGEVRWGRC